MRHSLMGMILVFGTAFAATPTTHERAREDGVWLQVTTPNFVIYTNGNEKSGRMLGLTMEKIRAVMAVEYPHYRLDPGRPLEIFAAKNNGSFLRLLGKRSDDTLAFWTDGLSREGLVGNYMICRGDPNHVAKRLIHEYVHLLHRINYAHMPLWLDEGLAEYYERSSLQGDTVGVGYLNRTNMRRLGGSFSTPLEALFQTNRSSDTYNHAGRASFFYAKCWALVHYLKTDETALRARTLENLCADLWAGKEPMEATLTHFGDLEDLRLRLEQTVYLTHFPHRTLHAPFSMQRRDIQVRALSLAESFARRGLYLADVGELTAAESYLQAAEAEGGDALTHAATALMLFRSGERVGALIAAQESVSVKPDGYLGYYLRGFLRGGQDGALDLRRALDLAPDFAPASAQLALLCVGKEARIDEAAVQLAREAIALEQGNLTNQMRLVQVLAVSGRYDEAVREGNAVLSREPPDEVRALVQETLRRAALAAR